MANAVTTRCMYGLWLSELAFVLAINGMVLLGGSAITGWWTYGTLSTADHGHLTQVSIFKWWVALACEVVIPLSLLLLLAFGICLTLRGGVRQVSKRWALLLFGTVILGLIGAGVTDILT